MNRIGLVGVVGLASVVGLVGCYAPECVVKSRQYLAKRRPVSQQTRQYMRYSNNCPNSMYTNMLTDAQEMLRYSSGLDIFVDVFDTPVLRQALLLDQSGQRVVVVDNLAKHAKHTKHTKHTKQTKHTKHDLVKQVTRQLCLYNIDEIDTIYESKVVIIINNMRTCQMGELEVLADKALHSNTVQVIVRTSDALLANSLRNKYRQCRLVYDKTGKMTYQKSASRKLAMLLILQLQMDSNQPDQPNQPNQLAELSKLMQDCPVPECLSQVFATYQDVDTCRSIVDQYVDTWRRAVQTLEA